MKKTILFIAIALFGATNLFAIDSLYFRLTIKEDGGEKFDKLVFGVHKLATFGFDEALGERQYPEMPPPDGLHAFFTVEDTISGDNFWSYYDIKPLKQWTGFVRYYEFRIFNVSSAFNLIFEGLKNSEFVDSAYVMDLFGGKFYKKSLKNKDTVRVDNFAMDKFIVAAYFNEKISDVEGSAVVSSVAKVYPNPTADGIRVNANFDSGAYFIYNSAGILTARGTFSSSVFDLNARNFSPGVYFLRIEGKNGKTETTSFVKIKQ